MDVKTDRLGLLTDQLETSCDYARARMEGLSDDEYLWEPAPNAWSVRRRSEATTSHAIGAGEWVLDRISPEPQPPPVTTIAWRLGHLYECFLGRWDWTFGSRSQDDDDIEFTNSASVALARFWTLMNRWIQDLKGLTEEQLDMVGFGQYPHGLDPQLPFIAIIWWTNRELIHHSAEIALLRDLWARGRTADRG